MTINTDHRTKIQVPPRCVTMGGYILFRNFGDLYWTRTKKTRDNPGFCVIHVCVFGYPEETFVLIYHVDSCGAVGWATHLQVIHPVGQVVVYFDQLGAVTATIGEGLFSNDLSEFID